MHGIIAVDAAVIVDLVQRAYAALATGDMDGLEQCFARDAVWHEPGDKHLLRRPRGLAADPR
jgi:ketosteroid isomerase-like protein